MCSCRPLSCNTFTAMPRAGVRFLQLAVAPVKRSTIAPISSSSATSAVLVRTASNITEHNWSAVDAHFGIALRRGHLRNLGIYPLNASIDPNAADCPPLLVSAPLINATF